MKKIFVILLYSAATDLLISSIKIFGGVISGSSALIADGFYTFSNFITDIVTLIGTKISKKRPNKLHPFGFGKVQYVASILMGFIIFTIGIFMLVINFLEKDFFPNGFTISIVFISILLKFFSSYLLLKIGKKEHHSLLITNAKISFTDIYSTSILLFLFIIAFFLKNNPIFHYIDILGGTIISIHILLIAFKLLKENIIAIIGEVDTNPELLKKLEQEVETIKNIDLVKAKLIKYGSYYKAQFSIRVNPNMKIKDFIKIEKRINRKIKKEKFGIKYITIDVVEYTKK